MFEIQVYKTPDDGFGDLDIGNRNLFGWVGEALASLFRATEVAPTPNDS
jgi:hypothetical protein